jgi:ubiquinone/menaquinone biosynthesis C-methylase UbiE
MGNSTEVSAGGSSLASPERDTHKEDVMTTAGTSNSVYGKTYGGSAPEIYQRYFVPVIGQPLAIDLVAAAEIRAGQRVLDVACGTGVVTRLAAERVGPSGSVAGADVNAAMLEVARSSSAGTQPPITWYETAAEAMPLQDASFDVVLCQLGLQFMRDKEAALREMRRVLVPGGRVFISVPKLMPIFEIMHDAVARHIDRETASFVHLVFSLNDPAALEHLLELVGFNDVTIRTATKEMHLPAAADFLWQYVQCTPLAPSVMAADESRRMALERDVVNGWQPWTDEGGVTYQQEMLLASGRR